MIFMQGLVTADGVNVARASGLRFLTIDKVVAWERVPTPPSGTATPLLSEPAQ